jgi:hypothetical protein
LNDSNNIDFLKKFILYNSWANHFIEKKKRNPNIVKRSPPQNIRRNRRCMIIPERIIVMINCVIGSKLSIKELAKSIDCISSSHLNLSKISGANLKMYFQKLQNEIMLMPNLENPWKCDNQENYNFNITLKKN